MTTDQMKMAPTHTFAVGRRCVSKAAGYALTAPVELLLDILTAGSN